MKEKTQPEESIERYSTVSLSAGKRSRRKRSKRPAFRIIFIIEKRDGYPSVQSHAGRRCQHWQKQLPHPTHLPNCRTQPPPHSNSRLLRTQTHQSKCLASALGLAQRPQAALSSGKFLESYSGSAGSSSTSQTPTSKTVQPQWFKVRVGYPEIRCYPSLQVQSSKQ